MGCLRWLSGSDITISLHEFASLLYRVAIEELEEGAQHLLDCRPNLTMKVLLIYLLANPLSSGFRCHHNDLESHMLL